MASSELKIGPSISFSPTTLAFGVLISLEGLVPGAATPPRRFRGEGSENRFSELGFRKALQGSARKERKEMTPSQKDPTQLILIFLMDSIRIYSIMFDSILSARTAEKTTRF